MTQLLQKAISELQKLPASKQDDLAATILEEIGDDRSWDESFAKSKTQLAAWAARVREDIEAGHVKPGGFDGE